MKIEFITRYYEFDHGHRPHGRGSWAFQFIVDGKKSAPWFLFDNGFRGPFTYSEAKKIAAEQAKQLRCTQVIVCP